MNTVIRIAQVIFALLALNNIFMLCVLLVLLPIGLASSSGDNASAFWGIVQLVVTSSLFIGGIVLLQRYYKSSNQPTLVVAAADTDAQVTSSQLTVEANRPLRIIIIGAAIVGSLGLLLGFALIIGPFLFL